MTEIHVSSAPTTFADPEPVQMPVRLDPVNLSILRLLEQDGRASVSSIARQVGLTDNAVRYRLRRLRASGVLRRVTVHVDPGRLGRARTALLLLQVESGADLATLSSHPMVALLFATRGPYQAAALVVARDSEDLDLFVTQDVRSLRGVVQVVTLDVQPGADLPVQPSACGVAAVGVAGA